MDVAIIGAAGACGRQLAMQLLDRTVIPHDNRLQLVGHRGGMSETELWGLRADLRDAFADWSPEIDIALEPDDVDADIVVMLAGATIPTDPNDTSKSITRADLGRTNAEIFRTYAEALQARPSTPIVIVQSNPVELGVDVFARYLGKHSTLGAAGWSDTMRWRGEIADDLGIPRRAVQAFVIGEHGDHLVPAWSMLNVRGVPYEDVLAYEAAQRAGRSLADLPDEIREGKARLLELIRAGKIEQAYEYVQAQPSDLRMGIKPFFVNFTAGRTTEAVTARAVADLTEDFIAGRRTGVTAQVRLDGQWHGVHGTVAAPVILGPHGWIEAVDMALRPDEQEALLAAAESVAATITESLTGPGDT